MCRMKIILKIMFNSVIEFWFKRHFFKWVLDDSRGNLNVKIEGIKPFYPPSLLENLISLSSMTHKISVSLTSPMWESVPFYVA